MKNKHSCVIAKYGLFHFIYNAFQSDKQYEMIINPLVLPFFFYKLFLNNSIN